MEKGQRVLFRPAAYPMAVHPAKVIGKGRREGFVKVRYCAWGVFYNEIVAVGRLEALADFGQFYGPAVVEVLEREL